MKTIRRLTSLLLAVCMLVAILPAGMFTASAAGEIYTYNFAAGLLNTAGPNSYNLMASANASAFSTMATYTGSTASWRFVRDRSNTSTVQHNGNGQETFGIFLFANGEGTNNYVTFEINIPSSGTYKFDLTYYNYPASGRACDVYLTSTIGNHPVMFDTAERIFSIATPAKGSEDKLITAPGEHGVQLAAGNYYLIFRPTQNDDKNTTYNYFFLHNVKVNKTVDSGAPAVAKPMGIKNNSGSVMAANATRQLYVRVLPHSFASGYAEQLPVTWGTSNSAVADVSSTGLVTAGATPGSAVIYATNTATNRREMVSVLVGNSNSQLYAINEDAQNYMRAATGITDVDFGETYTSYSHTTNADRWCFAHSSKTAAKRVAAYTSADNSWFGTFLDIGEIGTSITFKIEVEQDGNYLPEIAYIASPSTKDANGNRSGSVKANIYIYPTTYAAGSCPDGSYVTYTGSNSTSKTLAMTTGSSAMALKKGDYYVTFKTDSDTGRYVYLQHIALLYQGVYNNTTKVNRIVIDNPSPKMTAGDKNYKLGIYPVPSTVDQTITWNWAKDQNKYISVNNGTLTADSNRKGSNVISATIGGVEEVTSVSTGALLYTFNNVAKDYLAKNSLTSITFDYFDDYSKITTGDQWTYVDQDVTVGAPLPTVYQGQGNLNERYGAFLDFGLQDNKWIRFKIQVDKAGWYFPEVLYRDNGPGNMREVDVYISPTNIDPFTQKVATITPAADAPSEGAITAHRSNESIYLSDGEYYLTFYTGVNNYPLTSHYLYLYHLALVEDDASVGILAPKAVVIEKPEAAMKPLAVDDTVKLTARVLPINASQNIISWKSSNTDVAEVDGNGLVTAKANGVALITATSRDLRSEAVVIQVGESSQVYAFNEVIKKYLEVGNDSATNGRRVDISTAPIFTEAANSENVYAWQNVHNFGQGWRFIEKSSDSISNAYRGDSAQDDTGNDKTDPNFKYGLFLLSNSNDSYVRFEIDVEEAGEYLPEIIYYLSINASESQGSRQAEIYISPIATPKEYLTHDAYHVGTTALMNNGARETVVTDYGLINQSFNSIMLEKGKYNLVIKSGGTIGRYIYLHAVALHRQGEFVAPDPQDIVFTNNVDESLYLSANATHTLTPMVHPLLAEQSVIWESDNENVATVANGTVTTKNVTEGTALITATSTVDGKIVGKVRIIIGDEEIPTYKYDFVNPVRDYFKLDPKVDLDDGDTYSLFDDECDFNKGYDAAKDNGSDPWMLLDSNDPNKYCNYTVSTHEQDYGLFVMSSKEAPGTEVKFKFAVDEDANYGAILNISDWNNSNNFDVYVAPANATEPTAERWRVGDHKITKRTNLTFGLEIGELPLYAGEYIMTIKSTKVNFTGTNGGLISIHNLCLYRSGEAFFTIEGAQVRIEGKNQFGKEEDQGLRFISTIYKSEFNVDTAAIKEFGTLLVPESLLTDTNGDGVKDGFDLIRESPNAKPVAAKNRYVDHQDYVSFTAVVTGLKPAHYEMAIVARAYVILNNGDIIYGDTWTMRSIYDVAKNGWDKHFNNLKVFEKKAFAKIINAVEKTNYVVDDEGNVTNE